MIAKDAIECLQILCARVSNQDITWVLVGSTSLALQGVDVTPRDIDILTDEAGAYKINELLKDCEVKPVAYRPSDTVRSYWGEFRVNDVKVEVMGDYQERVRGKWQGLSSRLATPVIIQLGGMQLPVSSLEAQLRSYESAGQDTETSKIEAIRAALKRRRTAAE
jgi:hypothetical protein